MTTLLIQYILREYIPKYSIQEFQRDYNLYRREILQKPQIKKFGLEKLL